MSFMFLYVGSDDGNRANFYNCIYNIISECQLPCAADSL